MLRSQTFSEQSKKFTVEKIKNRITPVCKKYDIDRAVLFGSYAKSCADKKSDVDLLVYRNLKGLKFVELMEELKESLEGKEVDVLDFSHIEPNSLISSEIKSTGVKIYAR